MAGKVGIGGKDGAVREKYAELAAKLAVYGGNEVKLSAEATARVIAPLTGAELDTTLHGKEPCLVGAKAKGPERKARKGSKKREAEDAAEAAAALGEAPPKKAVKVASFPGQLVRTLMFGE